MGVSREYHRRWRENRLARGICQRCQNPCKVKVDGSKYAFCAFCLDKQNTRKRYTYVKKGYIFTRPKSKTPRSGITWCLRCTNKFASPDTRKIRICEECRPWYQSQTIDPDWAMLELD